MTPAVSDPHASATPDETLALGPLLYAYGYDAARERHALSVLLAVPEGASAPHLEAEGTGIDATEVDRIQGLTFLRYDFELPRAGGRYSVDGCTRRIALGGPEDDLRVAYVSCNGKEEGDFDRPPAERDAMWARLHADHKAAPFSLLIMGGDQIYADAALSAHPDVARWNETAPKRMPALPASAEAEEAVTAVFLDRWSRSVRSAPVAALQAEVPAIAMWDDHDIFDGYGSHPAEVQDSPIGQMMYRVARRIFRLFQAGGRDPAHAGTLTRALAQPGFHVLAPDLRSERRPDRVMGEAGWQATEAAFAALPARERVFLVSTVPALGPRLSLVEAVHRLIPGAQRYEDDLRDQWQSRAHRAEWRRFLQLAADHADGCGPVTFLSGEIHLAGRGEMRTPAGTLLHQLTASGVSHPPPPALFARALGALGALGEAPLQGYPISLYPLPGGRRRYVAERNVLLLERQNGVWRAAWDLEVSGRTDWLLLSGSDRDTDSGSGAGDARRRPDRIASPQDTPHAAERTAAP
ncbi:MAG: alkaline phosphatase D family protein [Pseudomonadota bacterium]